MADVDPETVLEWLGIGEGNERDVQLCALEQLWMLLLTSNPLNPCFERCPPRTFVPTLCRIFLDDSVPDSVLELTARIIAYYLKNISAAAEYTRTMVTMEGVVQAICSRVSGVVGLGSACNSRVNQRDLVAEQCIKVLELVCATEADAVFEANGLLCVLRFIQKQRTRIRLDTLHSAMAVVTRLCGKVEPQDKALPDCVKTLSILLGQEDANVADGALGCFASLADKFSKRETDLAPLASHGLVDRLLYRLSNAVTTAVGPDTSTVARCADSKASNMPSTSTMMITVSSKTLKLNSRASVSTIINLFATLCKGSPSITRNLLYSTQLPDVMEKALKGNECDALDFIRLIDLLLVLQFEKKSVASLSHGTTTAVATTDSGPSSSLLSIPSLLPTLKRLDSVEEKLYHEYVIDRIRSKDTNALIKAIDTGGIQVNSMDDVGQTLLHWATAVGTPEIVEFLCARGADVNKGQRLSLTSLHYAALFGEPVIAKILLRHGANPDLKDKNDKTPLDTARERVDARHEEVAAILQSFSGEWILPSSSLSSPTKQEHGKLETQVKEMTKLDKDDNVAVTSNSLKRLLSVFCAILHRSTTTMLSSIWETSQNLLIKMIRYIQPDVLVEVCGSDARTEKCKTMLVEKIRANIQHTEMMDLRKDCSSSNNNNSDSSIPMVILPSTSSMILSLPPLSSSLDDCNVIKKLLVASKKKPINVDDDDNNELQTGSTFPKKRRRRTM